MTIHVNHVVEVTKATSLGECTHFLCEQIGRRVTQHFGDGQGPAARTKGSYSSAQYSKGLPDGAGPTRPPRRSPTQS